MKQVMAFLFIGTISFSSLAAEKMSSHELAKSKAARFFATRQFEKALKEFRFLEAKYPNDLAIKRYIGASFYYLKKDSQAIETFKALLGTKPDDIPSHNYLGKIYMRLGETGRAKEHFSFIVKNDKSGTYIPFAKTRLEIFKRLESLKKKVKVGPGQIPSDQFLKTKAARAFSKAEYSKALKEFNELEKQYPKDLGVKRYKGLTLAKLSKFDEAVATIQKGLALDPNHVPLHYFLALVFISQKKYTEAKKELEFVDAHDTGSYQRKAKSDLEAIERVLAAQKNYSGFVSTTAEYNSNPALRSRKKAARVSAYESDNTLVFNYNLFRWGSWQTRAAFTHADAWYTDSLQQLDYTANTLATNFNYASTLFGNSFFGQFSPNYTYVTVNRHYYSQSYSPQILLSYSLASWWRVLLLEKLAYTLYNNKGGARDASSKQGWYHTFTFAHTFFLNAARTVSTKLTYQHALDRPEGANFWKDVNGGGVSLSFPLYFPFISHWISNWTGDLEAKFRYSDYPKYGRRPVTVGSLRFDEKSTASAAMNIPLLKELKATLKYTYINNNSKNDTFTYKNKAAGLTLAYTF